LFRGDGFNTVQTPSSSLTIKIASIIAKIEQGGRSGHLLSKLQSPDQILEDATDLRLFSRNKGRCVHWYLIDPGAIIFAQKNYTRRDVIPRVMVDTVFEASLLDVVA